MAIANDFYLRYKKLLVNIAIMGSFINLIFLLDVVDTNVRFLMKKAMRRARQMTASNAAMPARMYTASAYSPPGSTVDPPAAKSSSVNC